MEANGATTKQTYFILLGVATILNKMNEKMIKLINFLRTVLVGDFCVSLKLKIENNVLITVWLSQLSGDGMYIEFNTVCQTLYNWRKQSYDRLSFVRRIEHCKSQLSALNILLCVL